MSEGTSLAIPFHFQFEHCCLTLTSFEPASVVCFQDVSQKQVPEVKYLLGKAALLFPQFWNTPPRFTKCPLLLVLQDFVNDGSACVLSATLWFCKPWSYLASAFWKLRPHGLTSLSSKGSCFIPRITLNALFCTCSTLLRLSWAPCAGLVSTCQNVRSPQFYTAEKRCCLFYSLTRFLGVFLAAAS